MKRYQFWHVYGERLNESRRPHYDSDRLAVGVRLAHSDNMTHNFFVLDTRTKKRIDRTDALRIAGISA